MQVPSKATTDFWATSIPYHKAVSLTQNRRGMTLLEMIISLVILSGAVAVLVGLSRTGSINAASARDTTQAQLLCEGLMSEVETGIIPMEPVFEQPVSNFPDSGAINPYDNNDYKWVYTLEVNSLDENGLTEVIMTVSQSETTSAKNPVSCRLVRWMLDKATAKEMQQENQSQNSSQSASSQNSSSSGTSSQRTTSQ